MPRAQQTEQSFFNLSPIAIGSQYSTEIEALDFDHLLLFIDLTLSSMTSIDLYPQVSHDGTNWKDYYDANNTKVSWTFSADVDYARILGQANNVTRLHGMPIAAPLFRMACDGTGTPGSSTLVVTGIPYNMGALQDA